jgi:hypothetical protein
VQHIHLPALPAHQPLHLPQQIKSFKKMPIANDEQLSKEKNFEQPQFIAAFN